MSNYKDHKTIYMLFNIFDRALNGFYINKTCSLTCQKSFNYKSFVFSRMLLSLHSHQLLKLHLSCMIINKYTYMTYILCIYIAG